MSTYEDLLIRVLREKEGGVSQVEDLNSKLQTDLAENVLDVHLTEGLETLIRHLKYGALRERRAV